MHKLKQATSIHTLPRGNLPLFNKIRPSRSRVFLSFFFFSFFFFPKSFGHYLRLRLTASGIEKGPGTQRQQTSWRCVCSHEGPRLKGREPGVCYGSHWLAALGPLGLGNARALQPWSPAWASSNPAAPMKPKCVSGVLLLYRWCKMCQMCAQLVQTQAQESECYDSQRAKFLPLR